MAVTTLLSSHDASSIEARRQTARQIEQDARKTIAELNLKYTKIESPLIAQVEQKLEDWVKKYQIVPEEKLTGIKKAGFARLIANAHYEANLEESTANSEHIETLSTVVCFAVWLFFSDDSTEEENDQVAIEKRNARTIAILGGANLDNDDGPLNQGLHNIVERIQKICSSTIWRERLKKDVQDYCKGMLWELDNRKKGKVPSLEEYQSKRPDTSGTKVMFGFIEFVKKIVLSEDAFKSSYFQKARSLAVELVNKENDIISAAPEYLRKDVHNRVFVYAAQNKSGFKAAIQKAGKDLSADNKEFIEFTAQIPTDYGPDTQAVKDIIDGMQKWFWANHFWSLETNRYKIV